MPAHFLIRGMSLSAIGKMIAASLRGHPISNLHVFLCIADHFEPNWQGAATVQQRDRVDRWLREYPCMAHRFSDVRGRGPQHTFFYPAEEYNSEHLDRLAVLCRQGHGDVEVHLHHDNDTPTKLRDTLVSFKERLHLQHGLLERNADGDITYGFVHGNWALCNSHPDGRWCGVNDEITILRETGCYADFTLPAAPSPAQTTTINSIYYAMGDASRPKSHDRGVPARVGVAPPPESLLMIQGPTILDWTKRRSILPVGFDNGDLQSQFPPTGRRLNLWTKARIGVVGRPNWIFVKLHTHGAQERTASMLLGEPMREFHQTLQRIRKGNGDFNYYYVTARELAGLVHQAERGAVVPFREESTYNK